MPEELRELLIVIGACVPAGLAVGIALRKLAPGWCKAGAKFSMNGHWWVYAAGIVLFGSMAVLSFAAGMRYRGIFWVVFFVLEVFGLFFYGFRRLTPEMREKIDESDPTRLWPLRFWKQKKAD